jgi:hypothetical protein
VQQARGASGVSGASERAARASEWRERASERRERASQPHQQQQPVRRRDLFEISGRSPRRSRGSIMPYNRGRPQVRMLEII